MKRIILLVIIMVILGGCELQNEQKPITPQKTEPLVVHSEPLQPLPEQVNSLSKVPSDIQDKTQEYNLKLNWYFNLYSVQEDYSLSRKKPPEILISFVKKMEMRDYPLYAYIQASNGTYYRLLNCWDTLEAKYCDSAINFKKFGLSNIETEIYFTDKYDFSGDKSGGTVIKEKIYIPEITDDGRIPYQYLDTAYCMTWFDIKINVSEPSFNDKAKARCNEKIDKFFKKYTVSELNKYAYKS